MKVLFEKNKVGELKTRLWEASPADIDKILNDYEVPSPGEMDKPGCYIQNTVRAFQDKKKKKNDIVLIPLGSTEVHGFHCASGQDTLQASRICEAARRYTAKHGDEVNLAFSPWIYGNHPKHHVGMLGTIPISPSVLEKLLVDTMFGLWADGYRKFIFVNNHAQHWVITSAIDSFGLRYPELPFYAVAYDWCSAVWEFFQTKNKGGTFEDDFIHADEPETSLMLLLAPEMTDMKYAVDTKPRGYLPDGHFNKSANQLAFRPNLWWSVRNNGPIEFVGTPEGVVGRATLATAEKAKRPVAAALAYLTLLMDDILNKFPAGVLPPIEEVTLFKQAEVEGYLKTPGSPGYKNPYRLWKPF
ncbi:MAG: 3-dehydro-scyllo-inosose hydrolase [Kiritimatiellaeota bacterium]|nr:3-dehydro-scyllo-inosose hydrolase [Kiritimatiellota bacterium]